MRSALLCVSFILIVQGSQAADDDFKPMPIPLEWHFERRDSRAETLHESLRTEATPPAAQAHYWEDALRHSVYLTLVRDKIDQLIAKGDVISPDSKPDQIISKETDDHDLWEKIKTAPFNRIEVEEPTSYGDVTVMAKGRLMEEKGGFRFTEDEPSKEQCTGQKCMDGVKAIWSIKRVRQLDGESTPGKYHYELTFSVTSPKKQRKPYENPIRTFTVRESVPERVMDMPKENRSNERVQIPTPRPQRAIWVHKNIVPTQRYTSGRQYQHGLDRIFSSLFSDEDDVYEPPQRYRPVTNPHVPPVYSQFSKVGYVGTPSDQQKTLTPYPYKPHSYKYSRPPLPPPPYAYMQQHHFSETETFGAANNAFGSQPDHRYVVPQSTKLIKTTRPAVLPTPLPPIPPPKNWTLDGDKKPNTTEIITKAPEIQTVHKNYHKPRPTPIKINYISDHIRPPVYNAPPGVFVTMDKKPFKPMPPLKLIHSSKPLKHHKPTDFRPSPQVLDMQQFSEPDPLLETAFRPITWNYSDGNTTEKIEVAESSTQINNTRKQNTKGKKPPKKHENIKSQRITTSAPEIITVSSDVSEESDALEWANVVGAFTKTTPMVSQKEKVEVVDSTTTPTTTSVSTTTARRRTTTTTEAIEETTTTVKPTKRTRPPPKFTKPEKVKKHKRITTTTTKAPKVKATQDLTPQASSAAATKPAWNTTIKPLSTTPIITTTTTPKPIITTKLTTTTQTTSVTTETRSNSGTTQPKIKNRFRQSTLMQKGTSVKHDRWSSSTPVSIEKTRTDLLSTSKFPRRKGSNFQGYLSSTQRSSDEENYEDHSISSTLEVKPLSTSTQTYEETADQYENNSESSDYSNNHEDPEDITDENDEQESKDHTEYIFQSSSPSPSEITNEIIESEEEITTEQIITSPFSAPKNKTKCKKKKLQNTSTTEEIAKEMNNPTSPSPTTESHVTPSIFEELFGGFTLNESKEEREKPSTPKPELQEQESENHAQFVKLDDDLQEFLDSLEKGENRTDNGAVYDDEEEEEGEPSTDDEESFFDNEDEGVSARDSSDDSYDEYHDRPYSLIELMAME